MKIKFHMNQHCMKFITSKSFSLLNDFKKAAKTSLDLFAGSLKLAPNFLS